MKFYRKIRGGKNNKWLDSGSDLYHNPALAEVCALGVLRLVSSEFIQEVTIVIQIVFSIFDGTK